MKTDRSGAEQPLVVVTGASSGIGRAAAAAFAHEGYPLMCLARRMRPSDAPRNAAAVRCASAPRPCPRRTRTATSPRRLRLRTVPIPGAPAYAGYGLGLIVLNDFYGHDGEIPGLISAEPSSGSPAIAAAGLPEPD